MELFVFRFFWKTLDCDIKIDALSRAETERCPTLLWLIVDSLWRNANARNVGGQFTLSTPLIKLNSCCAVRTPIFSCFLFLLASYLHFFYDRASIIISRLVYSCHSLSNLCRMIKEGRCLPISFVKMTKRVFGQDVFQFFLGIDMYHAVSYKNSLVYQPWLADPNHINC